MKVERTGPSAFLVEFDDEAELQAEQRTNLAAGGLFLKTKPWAGNTDVLVALIHNPKLPLHLGLRVLPMLPINEVRVIAKGTATSAALKQAALRRVTTQ